MFGKTIEYPFDTIKVRLQSQPETSPLRYEGPLDCFRKSVRTEGIHGLYRGISAPLLGAAVETSSLFFSYRIAQDVARNILSLPDEKQSLSLSTLAACGAASGAFTSLILTPIELVKCQMQVPQGTAAGTMPGPLSVISSVYQHHGFRGFWYGQLGTLIRETGGSAAWFGSYEGVSMLFRQHDLSTKQEALPFWQQLVAGASAGVCYNFLFYPADTIKSRMQTEEVGPIPGVKRRTFWAVGKVLWQQQGLAGMYRGCGITVGRAAPSSAFIFAIYEGLRELIGSIA